MRLALLDPAGQTETLTVRVRGRSEIDVTPITHPSASGDTVVRYARAPVPAGRELRARLEKALHP